jgi:hypothetical protein
MNPLQDNQQKKKKPSKPIYNEIELDKPLKAAKDISANIAKGAGQVASSAWSETWDSIMGVNKYALKPEAKKHSPKLSGDLTPGQAVDLKAAAKKEQKVAIETPMNYHREIAEVGKTGMYKESAEIRQQVQGIMYELQRLAASSKAIQKEVTMATGTGVVNPGKYHVTFFEWMLTVVRDARKRVENAGAWLASVKSKKKRAIGGMKKNMSQFMSGERSVSNSVG